MSTNPQSITLAIDTSHSRGELVFLTGKHVLKSLNWDKQGSHSEILPREFQKAMAELKLNSNQIRKIYCVNGPGSFTGIRVAVNFAKSMAYALNCPLVAINGLDLLAVNCPHTDGVILSCIDAQKNSVFVGKYRQSQNQWEVLVKNQIQPILELQDIVDQSVYLCGRGLERYRDFLPPALHKRLVTDDAWKDGSLEKYLLTEKPIAKDELHSWNNFRPLYLKKSSAEEKLLS